MPGSPVPWNDPLFLEASLEGLRFQKRRIEEQIRAVERHLEEVHSAEPSLRERPVPSDSVIASNRTRLSAEARQRISQAQKKRWAEYRQRNGKAR